MTMMRAGFFSSKKLPPHVKELLHQEMERRNPELKKRRFAVEAFDKENKERK